MNSCIFDFLLPRDAWYVVYDLVPVADIPEEKECTPKKKVCSCTKESPREHSPNKNCCVASGKEEHKAECNKEKKAVGKINLSTYRNKNGVSVDLDVKVSRGGKAALELYLEECLSTAETLFPEQNIGRSLVNVAEKFLKETK